MAINPDPIQAAFQLVALVESDGIPEEDKDALVELRTSLRAAREAGTTAAWLDWYRRALDLSKSLGGRWTSRRQPNVSAAVSGGGSVQSVALGRLKEAPSTFVQRWTARLQDQSQQVREQLLRVVREVPVAQSDSGIQTVFEVSEDARAAVGAEVTRALNAWADEVSAALTPSWHEWVLAIMAEERASRASGAPPPWASVHLRTSAQLAPHIEASAARKVTALTAFQRGTQLVRGMIMLFAASTITLAGAVGGKACAEIAGYEVTGGVVGAVLMLCLTIAVVVPFSILYGRRVLADEREQARRDHVQRQLAALSSWVTSTIEGHRARMNTALSNSVSDMKVRMSTWVEANFDSPKRQVPFASDADRDIGPLLSSLSMARNAIATRVAQLELGG